MRSPGYSVLVSSHSLLTYVVGFEDGVDVESYFVVTFFIRETPALDIQIFFPNLVALQLSRTLTR